MKPQKLAVTHVKKGDAVETSTGMRSVREVRVLPNFVTLYVEDPGSRAGGVTALDYKPDAQVLVQR